MFAVSVKTWPMPTERSTEVFAANLRRIREQKGYSQENFAIKAAISRGHYGNIERGKHSPSLATIVQLAKALDVKTAELLRGID